MGNGVDLSLEGRCGSCRQFVEDHGDSKATYGHCGRKPRIGSVVSRDYKCEDYRMRPDLRRLLEDQEAARERSTPAPVAPAPVPVGVAAERRPAPRPAESEPPRTPADAPPQTPGGGAAAAPGARGPGREELRAAIADALDDLLGLSSVHLADRWRGGTLVLRPANPALQEKELEIERFWHKITMIRDQLRNLERAVNGHAKLDPGDRLELQQYITRCYGSLTTFNVLFRDKEAMFRGQKKDD
jgi:hypothetical protein